MSWFIKATLAAFTVYMSFGIYFGDLEKLDIPSVLWIFFISMICGLVSLVFHINFDG